MARVALLMDLPKNSGAGRYAVELQRRITEPFAIDYLYFDYDQRTFVLEGEKERRILAKTHRIPAFDNKVWFWRRLKKHIPEYDLYHFITPNLSFLVPKGKNSLVTCHDIAPLFTTSFCEKQWRRYLYSGLKRAKALIADSASTRRDLCQAYGFQEADIPVIPLGVDQNIFRPIDKVACRKQMGLPLERKIVLSVALELRRKNIPGLIRVIAHLKETLSSVLLVRVGVAKRATADMIKSLDLIDHVRYVPTSTEEDLVCLYNSADVFAFPSIYEGFGLPILEAMACGTPVVASNRTSVPEVVGESGILVDPEDIQRMASEIKRVLTEPALAKDLSNRGLDRASIFTWERTATKTSDVYKDILSAKRKG